jgi:hypothetical protein
LIYKVDKTPKVIATDTMSAFDAASSIAITISTGDKID